MKIITLAGNLGSGKSTICKILKEKYDSNVYSTGKIMRDMAEKRGLTVLEFNELAKVDPSIDRSIDEEVVNILKQCTKDTIFDSRMAWHFIEESFKVFLVVNPAESANRVTKDTTRGSVESYTSQDEAESALLKRSQKENLRFKEKYGVDNLDLNNYDLVLDATFATPEELADIIYNTSTSATSVQGFNVDNNITKSQIKLSTKNIYPTDKIQHISQTRVDFYRDKLSKGEKLEPVTVIYKDGLFFLKDGHHRLVANMLVGNQFINAKLSNTDFINLPTELSYLGISTLYDYEDIGHFTYKKYPKEYRG